MNNRRAKYSGCGSSAHIIPLMSSRRDFLQVGLIGGISLTLPQLLNMEANAAQKFSSLMKPLTEENGGAFVAAKSKEGCYWRNSCRMWNELPTPNSTRFRTKY